MSENFKIHISGIKSDCIHAILNKDTNNIQITHDSENNSVQLQIVDPIDDALIVNTLEGFINSFNEVKQREIIPLWFFDENNSCIQGPKVNYRLTSRELLFLKMLLKKEKIVTYDEMFEALWKNRKTVSRNAMRVFAKNIKKKLPANILVNLQDIGYKLAL